jgi:cytoskeletal protein CcmA (bactofilin family)
VFLKGSVTGDVRCEERIELSAKAKVNGDVYYNLIEMAMGAEVNGSLLHQTDTLSPVTGFEHEQAGTANRQRLQYLIETVGISIIFSNSMLMTE